MYSIKEVSERLHCKANAIRFYEKKGLIAPTRDHNGYRRYTEEDIELLQFILLYRQLGFSIDAIRQIAKQEQKEKLDIYTSQFAIVNQQIHSMVKIRDALGEAIDELLEKNALSHEIRVQLEDTIQTIRESDQWKDHWGFNDWAANYDRDIRKEGIGLPFYKNYDQVINMTANEVGKKTGRVIEIGIGTGNLTKKILEISHLQFTSKDIMGVDQSVNMLKEAKRKLPQVAMRQGTFLKIPVEDCYCETVVSSYAFHHCNEKEKALAVQEMGRVIKPGGRIIITDLMFADEQARHRFEEQCTEQEKEELEDEYFTNIDRLEKIFHANGFTLQSIQIDSLMWMVVGEKESA
ncbi:MerR family transcriptional regulator [Anaerosporobacter faecicola]|uniref:MerR family transcriptional regulator n=1 Tax=Anaerosporobacter faecicola TaxID=2718714 RepID=UPI001438D41B|nr:MerR family transcriptional regulator [Anaerosporobacter faecicola]